MLLPSHRTKAALGGLQPSVSSNFSSAYARRCAGDGIPAATRSKSLRDYLPTTSSVLKRESPMSAVPCVFRARLLAQKAVHINHCTFSTYGPELLETPLVTLVWAFESPVVFSGSSRLPARERASASRGHIDRAGFRGCNRLQTTPGNSSCPCRWARERVWPPRSPASRAGAKARTRGGYFVFAIQVGVACSTRLAPVSCRGDEIGEARLRCASSSLGSVST
jgi:hypothetical protein